MEVTNTELLKAVRDYAKECDLTTFKGYEPLGDDEKTFTLGWAMDYSMFYAGEFPYMITMSEKVRKGETLSQAMVNGILNCILREAKQTLPKETKEVDPGEFILSIPVVSTEPETGAENDSATENIEDFTEPYFTPEETENILGKVVDTKSGDVYIVPGVEDKTAQHNVQAGLSDLAAIEEKMAAIQKKINAIEADDPVVALKASIAEAEKEEKVLFEAFEAQIKEMRKARQDKTVEMLQIQGDITAAKQELSTLALQHEDALKAIEVAKHLDEIEERLQALREDMPWKDEILNYQWEDVCTIIAAFLDGKNGVLNANDMGLGKTAESAFVVHLLSILFPERYGYAPKILWLTKKSLMKSSIKEVRKWNPDMVMMPISGNKTQREFIVDIAVANNNPVIANYDALNTTPKLMETTWDIIIMDEVHKLKGGANYNPTKVWENSVAVCQRAKFIMPLSGSPIQNHPKEMWAYLYMLEPSRFPSVQDFTQRFCWGYDDGLTVDWERLIKILSNRVIRRSKEDVKMDLPDKTREFRYVEMGAAQRKVYDSLRDEFFVWLDENKQNALTATSILAQLTRLRQVAIFPGSIKVGDATLECEDAAKLDEAMDIVEQLLANDEQVAIFSSQFNGPLFELQTRIENEYGVKVETITGANSSQTQEIEDRFRTGDTKVLCINMKSGGEGLNLQAASHAIFLDLWWNPMSNRQAEDRLHRMGQKNAVTIHVLQAEDSVDAFISAILEKKEGMIEGVMESPELRGGKDWKTFLQEVL